VFEGFAISLKAITKFAVVAVSGGQMSSFVQPLKA
jgi:hypothetical protein